MPIVFAISLVALVWLSETLRQGVFGMNIPETNAVTHIAAAAFAILILRTDLVALARRPMGQLYGSSAYLWSIRGSITALAIAPLVLVIPVVLIALGQISAPLPGSLSLQAVLAASQPLILKTFALAFCVELFFREAALKAFQSSIGGLLIASTLAYFVFRMSDGLATALIAAGSGMFFLTLRLIGAHIIVVAFIHTIATLALVLCVPDLLNSLPSAIFFTVAVAAISLSVYSFAAPKRIELSHA